MAAASRRGRTANQRLNRSAISTPNASQSSSRVFYRWWPLRRLDRPYDAEAINNRLIANERKRRELIDGP